MLGITMSLGASEDEAALRFTLVFCIVTLGASVITLNGKMLGGSLNFFQSVCTIGYCLFPMNLASIFGLFVSNGILRGLVLIFCFTWANYAALGFLDKCFSPKRRILGVYPVFLFYLCLTWMILVQ